MDLISEENYIIAQAKRAHESDPFTAKAWIITAKTLYPNNFNVQFEAYKIEKAARNYEEAAKCFSYIILTFQNQPVELWKEVSELTAALRVADGETTPTQDFYVKMFQHVSYDVQHKILLLTANHTDSNMDHCKLLLLLLKRFPQAIITHSSRLLETIAQGMSIAPIKYQEILVNEALPLLYQKTPDLPSHLVLTIYTISLEYYVKQICDETQENRSCVYEVWKNIFQVLTLCAKILKWENFLPFNKTWSKDVYWQKLIQIATLHPTLNSENKQIFFYATTLFIFSLQDYMMNTRQKIDDVEVEFVMVTGFKDRTNEVPSNLIKMFKQPDGPRELPSISITPPCSKETSTAFLTAANCWQLLNSQEQFQREFSQLLIKLPLNQWISRFLFDLAVYFGQQEEAKKLLNEMHINSIHQNIRVLSLILIQGPITIQGFECILKILIELPLVQGQLLESLTNSSGQRHVILLPLTQRAIIQYCTKAIVQTLSRKIFEPNCPDMILGNLLVLSQLNYPRESHLAEQIFSLIRSRGQFTYLLFPSYIVAIDFLEEFMNIWESQIGGFNLELLPQTTVSTRRIGTRGADKGVKEDFKQIMKQQVNRSNEDIAALIAQFMAQERLHLIQNIL